MLEAEGWVMVNNKPAADKTQLKGSKSFWRLKGGWVMVNKKPQQQIKSLGRAQVILEAEGWVVSV